MMDMQRMAKIANQIEQFYADETYTDIDGQVWVGTVDERWHVEGKEMDEDPKYWLTNGQMQKKMINEVAGFEQERRDAAVRLEARYEYAVQRTSLLDDGREFILGNYWGEREERETALKGMQMVSAGYIKYRLVKRRKPGPVEVV